MAVKVKYLPADASADDLADAIAENLMMSKDVVRGAGWSAGQLSDAFDKTVSAQGEANGLYQTGLCLSAVAMMVAYVPPLWPLSALLAGTAGMSFIVARDSQREQQEMVRRIQSDALYHATRAQNRPQPQPQPQPQP